MALPRKTDTYEDYTDQLVYFAARLAANPVTTPLAHEVETLLSELDADFAALRDARREEIRKRALRDHQDDAGDEQVLKLRRRLRAVVGNRHYVVTRLYPKGADHAVAPRGRLQIERLSALAQAIDDALQAPQLAADPDKTELTEILQAGRTTVQQLITDLTTRVTEWETQSIGIGRAVDTFNFRRSDGVRRLGVVMGELRAALGGSSRAAYTYTQPNRTPGTPDDDTPDDDNEETGPTGDTDGNPTA